MKATIEISKECLNFSAAHFTIFSATERERLHGHNFSVRAEASATVNGNGLLFNYQILKKRLRTLCSELDEYVIIPEKSPFVEIRKTSKYVLVGFDNEEIPFLEKDIVLLPIVNATIEEYARYILERVISDEYFIQENNIETLTIGVSSGAGQWGSCSWKNESKILKRD